MTSIGWGQLALYIIVILLAARPLGGYMARVYAGEPVFLDRILGPIERLTYRLLGVDPRRESDWREYTIGLLLFSTAGFLAVYLVQRVQGWLPLNPAGLGAVSPHLSFNTAVSFTTNTNWQSYGGETTLSYFTQMVGLTVQNFVSAAAGMAAMVALARGFARKNTALVGNFWVDLTRSTLHILLPLSLVLALALVSQGVVQTFRGPAEVTLLEPLATDSVPITSQTIALGPAASQVAIKQLGTNGGGFFNVNSAHPLENPTPLSNFLEVLAILLIPGALCVTFGRIVGNTRQGWALLAAMTIVLVGFLVVAAWAEGRGTPLLANAGADIAPSALHTGGNMEGKEVRFGIANSALWATATTAASNGSVNSMHDSFTPLGGLVPMVMMQLGEVIFGGVGSGLYGLIVFAIVAVFVAGLMVGRTPEFMGKKIEAFEMKMAALAILAPAFAVLAGTAVASVTPAGAAGVLNGGPHGFSEILYAFSSAGNNNGSAFAGLTANSLFYDSLLGLAMLVSRFWVMIPVMAIAGSLASKKQVPAGPGTLPTTGPLFVVLLIGTVLLVGLLTFVPALALGPIVEHIIMVGG